MISLTDLQKRIVRAAQLNAGRSISEIAKVAQCPARAVQYHLTKLVADGVVKKAPFLNVYPLGYRYVNIYFSLGSAKSASLQDLTKFLCDAPQVSWCAELGGEFHLGVSILVRHMEEAKQLLNSLPEQLAALLYDRAYIYHTRLAVFPYKHLSSDISTHSSLEYGNEAHYDPSGPSIHTDELDLSILRFLSTTHETSGRAVARALGKPHATVESRMRRLEREGVIAGYWYLVDPSAIGRHAFKALLYVKGPQKATSDAIYDFSVRHPHIVYFIEGIGSWDLELGIDIEHPREIAAVHQDLLDNFGVVLNNVKIVPQFRVLRLCQFP